MRRQRRLGRRQLAIIDALYDGATLYRYFEDGSERFLLGGNQEAPADSVRRLIDRGLLVENPDGMFGVGMSYRLAEGGDHGQAE